MSSFSKNKDDLPDNFQTIAHEHLLAPLRRIFQIEKTEGGYKIRINESEVRNSLRVIGEFFTKLLDSLLEHIDEIGLAPGQIQELQKLRGVFSKLDLTLDEPKYKKLLSQYSEAALVLEASINEKLPILPLLKDLEYDMSLVANGILEEGSLLLFYKKILSQKSVIDRLSVIWRASDLLGKRWPILQKALEAHLRLEHELSIPILLIHVEAIFGELFTGEASGQRYFAKKRFVKRVLLQKAQNERLEDFLLKDSVLATIIDEVLAHTDDLEKIGSQIPNRHSILHGLDLRYFEDGLASVRCIVLIDSLREVNLNDYRTSTLK